jgi:hypothetical protein
VFSGFPPGTASAAMKPVLLRTIVSSSSKSAALRHVMESLPAHCSFARNIDRETGSSDARLRWASDGSEEPALPADAARPGL